MKTYMIKKAFWFVVVRAVEVTVLYFFYGFITRYFEGVWAQVLLGVTALLYLMHVVGGYVDDYKERHRYDDVIV